MQTENDLNDKNINPVKQEELGFTLLREEATEVDSFEDKTHENIVETLYKLIKNQKGGVTIGLEGSWGSGKSVVISILEKKLENETGIHFFSFDAWAHEGDPLRRIFLEALMGKLFTSENKEIKELKEKIARRSRHCDIKTTRSATWLGKFLAITSLLVPIGLGLFQKVNLNDLTCLWTGEPYGLFWGAVVCMVAPFLILFANLFRLILFPETRSYEENGQKKYRKIWDTKNWPLIQSDSTEDITQQSSEEHERSSIEFEKYFEEIMQKLLDDKPAKKLVIVLDNLDRIDTQDALKIWSTLQTFLQQRNTPSNKKGWFEKIWVIVPYDPVGLAKLWDKNGENEREKDIHIIPNVPPEDKKEKEEKSAQFFDKCFQLKLEVPKPILTAWEQFAKVKIDEAFAKWDSIARKEVLNILILTRKTLNDIPTPRQIKNYINQVGLLRMHSSKEIPIESIAYYVVQRLLEKQSVDDLRKKLLHGGLPEESARQLVSESCGNDLAGLVFGVSPNKGQQLLLEPDIYQALKSGNGEKLKKLQEKHLNGFWAVFALHIQNIKYLPIEELLTYSKAICDSGLWTEFKEKIAGFSKRARKVISESKDFKWPDEKDLDSYKCLLIVIENERTCELLYEKIMHSLDSYLATNNQIDTKLIYNLKELNNSFKINTQFKLKSLTFEKFIQWAQISIKSNIPAWQWIIPEQSLVNHFSDKITTTAIIPPGISEALMYSIKANTSEDLSSIVSACKKHIIYNNGTRIPNVHSPEVFDILFTLAFNYDRHDAEIKNLLNDGRFYELAGHFYRKVPTIQIALLCAKYLRHQLNTFVPVHKFGPNHGQAINIVQGIKNYWNNRNTDNANLILSLLKNYNSWNFLWDLAEDPNNKLLLDIVIIALQDNEAKSFFNTKNGLQKIKILLGLLRGDTDESVYQLAKALIEQSSLEKEIIHDSELDISEYSKELCYIVKSSDNLELLKYLTNKINQLTKEKWIDAFKNYNNIIVLAIALKDKEPTFGLENNYSDAFFEFAKDVSIGSIKLTGLQKNSWRKLILLMSNAFQINYKRDLTKFLLDKYNEISDDFIELNKDNFDYNKMQKDIEAIQDIIKNSITTKNFLKLKWINDFALNNKFKPTDDFSEIIKNPLNQLYHQESNNSNHSELIKTLANKFKIELIKMPKEDANGMGKILVDNIWRLFYNPDNGNASKPMRFDRNGIILEGNNNNESSWRIQNNHLEFLDSDGKVHGRFKYDFNKNRFDHTNDPDTGSIKKHSIKNQYMILEV